jgi:excinuclease ABC subunit B
MTRRLALAFMPGSKEARNRDHGITPQGIRKAVRDITERVKAAAVAERRVEYITEAPGTRDATLRLVKDLDTQIKQAAKALEFEKAALLRDRIIALRKEMVIEDRYKSIKMKEANK